MTGWSPRVAVIGGGITGLVAARRLTRAGAQATVFEAASRPGGQVHTVRVDEFGVDLGAESLHKAATDAFDLVCELGLEDELVHARPGPTWVWSGKRLRRLPAGMGPAGPSRLWPVVTSRLLSARGTLRAALEPIVPASRPDADVSVGAFLTRRFGRELTERLVSPLLGGLHAGDPHRLSLEAASPQLHALARERRSLLLAGRRRGRMRAGFVTFRTGLGGLVDALVSDPAVTVRTSSPVAAVVPAGSAYRLEGAAGCLAEAEAVVLAVPARVASHVLAPIAPEAAGTLGALHTATVATAVLAYPRSAVACLPAYCATGLLVDPAAGRLLKAATFLSTKWPHLSDADRFLVRVSAGRADEDRVAGLDDSELVERLHAELGEATGLDVAPLWMRVRRWPATMPQLEVGHRDRIARVRHDLHRRPGLVLAGAAYDGVGLASCIRAGRRAATDVLDQLGATANGRP